jgi:hypothetical protein
MIAWLNNEQHHAFESIINTVLSNNAGFFFVSGYGGTGKTFLWNTIITYLCGHKKIVLSIASSGVVTLLLLGGRTAHSRFRIPCDTLDEATTCNIKHVTMLCELIQSASLIIWDEALMTHKIAFEALDRTLCDIDIVSVPSSTDRKLPFGGKVVVLGGDPRQTAYHTKRFTFRDSKLSHSKFFIVVLCHYPPSYNEYEAINTWIDRGRKKRPCRFQEVDASCWRR